MNRKKLYYLNSSSTNYKQHGQFNMADALYEQNQKARKEIAALEEKIKALIGAPKHAKVIFNSGATESIATCVHWAVSVNPYGTIVGTKYDHSAISENCQIYNVDYDRLIHPEESINDRTSAIFITQVDSKTGEIYNVNSFVDNINGYQYLHRDHSDFTNMNYKKLLQYEPLRFLDATQSITKVPIKMEEWGMDAVFWSNHKIGGEMGKGVLVIDEMKYRFVPLIAGAQNNGLRGGSQSAQSILKDKDIYNHKDNIQERKKHWLAARDFLKSKGITVYEPTGAHLYNTLLMDTNYKCPYTILGELSAQNIYLSPKSACMMEKRLNEQQIEGENKNNNNWVQVGGDDEEAKQVKPFDNAIRLSFLEGSDIDSYVLETIAETINEAFRSGF